MRIARIEARWVHVPIAAGRRHTSDFGRVPSFDSVIVRIDTACGITGWGEAKAHVGSAAACAGLAALIGRDLAPLLVGQDPRDIGRLWEVMYSTPREGYALAQGHPVPQLGRRGLTLSAIAGIDIALWDILGQSLGAPVWRLLGGRRAERMPAYASGGYAGPEGIGEELQVYIARGGFRAVKIRIGAMDGSPARSAARVRAARAALGPGIGIAADAGATWSVAAARAFCRMAEECDLMWLEEPVSGDDKRGMAEVRACSAIPVAAGESEFTRHDFRDLAELRAVDIMQPDLAIAGGITEAMRISALASAFNLRFAPHLWSGAIGFAAGLAVAAASPAGFILEYALAPNPMMHELSPTRFPVEDGMIAIPDRPGLGVEIDQDFLARHTVAGA